MGRWAQARKRGGGRALVGFPLPPPAAEEWDPFSNSLQVWVACGVPCPGAAVALQAETRLVGVPDFGSPADIPCLDNDSVESCAGGFTYEVRTRWVGAGDVALSDWSAIKSTLCSL